MSSSFTHRHITFPIGIYPNSILSQSCRTYFTYSSTRLATLLVILPPFTYLSLPSSTHMCRFAGPLPRHVVLHSTVILYCPLYLIPCLFPNIPAVHSATAVYILHIDGLPLYRASIPTNLCVRCLVYVFVYCWNENHLRSHGFRSRTCSVTMTNDIRDLAVSLECCLPTCLYLHTYT